MPPTPLYVIQALAEVRNSALTNMLDRDSVEMLVTNQRAAEWINKAADSEYMEALNDMGAAESDDFMGADQMDSENPGEEFRCPICGQIDNGDVTIADHGECYSCHQKRLADAAMNEESE